DQLTWIDQNLTDLRLSFKDSNGRTHYIEISLSNQYPNSPPICSAELPEQVPIQWDPSFTLKDVLRQYREAVKQYTALWDQLEDLDKHTWVIEPQNPTLASTMRRIVLADYCWLQIELVNFADASLLKEKSCINHCCVTVLESQSSL